MDTYKGIINEFIDWITGNDSFTNRNVSEGLPISGSSIRQLLQERLKKPIIVYDDEEAGLYRLFSSAVARDRWISGNNPQDPSYDPEGVAGLEIFNFERPSEFILSTDLSSDPRYIIKGDTAASEAEIEFKVNLKDKEGQTKSDSIVVTYTITNNITGVTKSFSEPYGSSYVNNNDNKVRTNIYEYLQDGINSVNVNIKASTISNSIDVGFSIYMINFALESSFDFNAAKAIGNDIDIPFEITRSSVVEGATLQVTAEIDGSPAILSSSGANAVWSTIDTSSHINASMKVRNSYDTNTLHTLKLVASMVSGHTAFTSNILYYTFEIASDANDIVNHFINIGTSIANNKAEFEDNKYLILRTTQYDKLAFNWSYYTDQIQNEQSISITWALRRTVNGVYEYENISTATAVKNRLNTFSFIPEVSTTSGENAHIVALYNGNEIGSWPIVIEPSSLNISKSTGYDLELTAYGRSNNSPTKNIWRDEVHDVDVTFSEGVGFDSTAGWDENSFMAIGNEAYANVGYVPFPNNFGSRGRTIEVDFKSEQVNDDDDILMDIGHPTAGRITITPTKATVWLAGVEIISTHYKANERIKLAFIFNKNENASSDDLNGGLVYIVNNGILERAHAIGSTASYPNSNGIFKIGGSQSGIRVYTIRAYPIAISYMESYNNFVYDSDNKSVIINRNDILSGGSIIYEECSKKIDTILIEGDISKLLDRNSTKSDSESTVNITRTCVSDPSKNFTVINGKIRKHGQSTLNYPITSLKIWFNKSATDGVNPTVTLSALQTAMGLNKNRYIMKDGAIPANKFVLQANYADSSGSKNGSLERLIQDTWYSAVIDGEYKLRTAPQLFASGELIHHNDPNLGETRDNEWVEGYGTDAAEGKVWTQLSSKTFPYKIRNAADSFPCVVFYRNTTGEDTSIHFLGQYVFMDDKKSDHVFGERSIYKHADETDPFCLKVDNKDEDTKANRVWNNNKVVRIEVVLLDNVLTSYMNYNVPRTSSDQVNSGVNVPCDTIKYDSKGNALNFYWEDYFEMIYPDPDDFEVKVNGVKVKEDKFAANSQFREKAQYFLDFLQWITSVAALNSTGSVIEGTKVTQAALNKFKAEAHDHLDVYKLAAYYIFFLRFGLVDSVERNAQLKTYDGQHWHYEPWDMDIAIGDKNNGGFAFNPPMTRDTKLPTDESIYAYSGRSTTTSNVLWDCLEAWDYWRDTIVPKVAQALYTAGLTYDVITRMFDEEYSNKWSEVLYNESCHFKYINARGTDNDWLAWLQGAGVSHRHWWLSKSMNYYDAMWTVGDFNNHRIYLAVTKETHAAGTDIITIKPTSETFFKLTQGDGTTNLGIKYATKEPPATYDVSLIAFNKKDPTHIYGATFIEELDLSCFAQKLETLTLTGAYDNVLGAPIKKLNIGIPITEAVNGGVTTYSGYVSGTRLALSASNEQGDALGNIKVLDITGQQSIGDTTSLLYANNRRTLTDFYAIGSGLTSFTTARSGNKFNELRLPAKTIKTDVNTNIDSDSSVLISLRFIDSTWENISFWTTRTTNAIVEETITYVEDGEEKTDTIVQANPATFENAGIPASITSIQMEGSTASNLCAAQLVMGWLDAIANKVASDYPSLTGDDLEAKVLEVLSDYHLEAENISWGTQQVPVRIYYKDLARLAALNSGNNQNANLKGYICVADSTQFTPVQLTQLRSWFGESVFNKSNINSGLIVDQLLADEYIQINVGRDAYVDTDENEVEGIYLQEGHTAILNATKFILSEDISANKIVGVDEVESDESNTYWWSLSSQTSGYGSILEKGNDGIVRIKANESVIGDHVVTVTVSRGNVTRTVDINIVGVTYPDDYVFGVRSINGNSRQFTPTVNIATEMFGAARIYQVGSNSVLRDIYAIYNSNLEFEFYVNAVNGAGKTATYKRCEYQVYSIDGNVNTGWIDANNLKGGEGSVQIIDDYLVYKNNAIHSPINGIVLATTQNMPAIVRRYMVAANVYIGGATITRYVNIVVLNDNVPIVNFNTSDPLYTTLRAKVDSNLTRALYKTDLLAIDGTLTFTNASNLVTAQVNNEVKSIFKYLPYVTVLDMTDCTITMVNSNITDSDKRVLNLSEMKKLRSLILTGVTPTVNGNEELIVDVSDCESLVSFLATGTNNAIGIKADFADGNTNKSNALTTISLGSPYYVYLESTSSLVLGNVSAQSSVNLTDVHIEKVNRGENIGFRVFNNLFV